MKNGKIAYMSYVNGEFVGTWILNDCEERRRFFERKTRPLHSKEQQKTYRFLAKLRGEKYTNPEFVSYTPYWRSFVAFKKHLLANNTDILYVNG